MKKISVIIPCYNVERLIDRCLSSLTDQTIATDQFEIICVDDCSKDSTPDRLKIWEEKYPDLIILITLDRNSRQGTARNTGLSYASGEYIAFVDSDDWVEPDYLERMYDTAAAGDLDLVQCELIRDPSESLTLIDPSEKKTGRRDKLIRISSMEDRKEIFHSKVINNPPRKLIRRSLLTDNRILFSEGLAYEDSYWGVLLNMYFESACILEEKLYHYYINPDSTVLTKNAPYHVDLITNQILLWEELKDRGFMSELRDEIEIEFVYSCALIFWEMLALRYDDPPYSLYRLLSSVVKEHIPEIMENVYMKQGELTEFQRLMLKSCLNELTESEFREFAENVGKVYRSI